MKKFLLSLILTGVMQFSFTQTIKLCDLNNQTINSGDTIQIDSLPSVNEMVSHIKVINLTAAGITVYCEKSYEWTVTGSTDEFCFAGACYPMETLISNNQLMAATDTNSEFSGHYIPYNHLGSTLIKYTFKVIHGDEAWFYVNYNGTLGIEENNLTGAVSKPYPNPVRDIVNIDYSLTKNTKAALQILNVIGKVEKQYIINDLSGKVSMDVSGLPSGIYFCVFNVNGKAVKTQRIIISK